MRVIATAVGFDNITTRQPGEEFDVDVDPKVFAKDSKVRPTWFVPAKAVKVAGPSKDESKTDKVDSAAGGTDAAAGGNFA